MRRERPAALREEMRSLMSTENPRTATSATGPVRQLDRSWGLSLTGRVIAAIGGALLVSAIWTPWFFGLVGTAVVLSGMALLEYHGPYDETPPTSSPTPITIPDSASVR
jgi:hypothetical protein